LELPSVGGGHVRGICVASTVAATHLKTLLANGDTASGALTGSFQWALWVCAAIGLLAVPTTAVLLRRRQPSGHEGAMPALEVGGGS
jgi:hypothetical protein